MSVKRDNYPSKQKNLRSGPRHVLSGGGASAAAVRLRRGHAGAASISADEDGNGGKIPSQRRSLSRNALRRRGRKAAFADLDENQRLSRPNRMRDDVFPREDRLLAKLSSDARSPRRKPQNRRLPDAPRPRRAAAVSAQARPSIRPESVPQKKRRKSDSPRRAARQAASLGSPAHRVPVSVGASTRRPAELLRRVSADRRRRRLRTGNPAPPAVARRIRVSDDSRGGHRSPAATTRETNASRLPSAGAKPVFRSDTTAFPAHALSGISIHRNRRRPFPHSRSAGAEDAGG